LFAVYRLLIPLYLSSPTDFSMQLTRITPVMYVENVRATIDYYTSVLGFDEQNYSADGDWGCVEKHKVQIMLSRPPADVTFGHAAFTGSFYITTDDAEAWWNYLEHRAEIVYPLQKFEYGMLEFALRDCNGYLLQFGQPLDQ
jgi:uncharacterized glyoxalase superfamily protein PhnB